MLFLLEPFNETELTSVGDSGKKTVIKYLVLIAHHSADPLKLSDFADPLFAFRSTSSPPWYTKEEKYVWSSWVFFSVLDSPPYQPTEYIHRHY